MEKPAKRIVISGYYGEENLGDEAILAALLDWLRRNLPSPEITVVSLNPALTNEEHGVEAVAYDNLYEIDRLIAQADLVINGGGGIFQEYNPIEIPALFDDPSRGIISYALTPTLAAMYEVPCLLFAHGVGPITTDSGARLVAHVFNSVTGATVRDEESLALLRELGVKRAIPVGADPTLLLTPAAEARIVELREQLGIAEMPAPQIGISLRSWFEWPDEEAIAQLRDFVDRLLENTGGTVIFLPFQTKPGFSDITIIDDVYNGLRCTDRVIVPEGKFSPGEMLGLIGKFDLLLGMRFHSLLFAIISGVPCAGFSFDPKLHHILTRAGMEKYYLDLSEGLTANSLQSLALDLLGQRESIRKKLLGVKSELQIGALVNFVELEKVLSKEKALLPGWLQPDAPDNAVRLTKARQLKHAAKYVQEMRGQLRTTLENAQQQIALVSDRAQALYNESLSVRHLTGKLIRAIGRKLLPERIRHFLELLYSWPGTFGLERNPEQNLRIYTRRPDLFANRPERVLLGGESQPIAREPVTLITTVKNEGKSIWNWLDSIRRQTRMPEEIVITDGGSTDDTVKQIEEFERQQAIGIRLICAPGANISRGRNLAVHQASNDIIAITDAGCELAADWLETITRPFDIYPATEVAAGFYTARRETPIEKAASRFLVADIKRVDPGNFSPSSRSVAFRKGFLEQIGGYPEYLTLAGEDTLLNYQARKNAREWAFVPDALVTWHPPHTIKKLFRTLFSWARGDAEAGLYQDYYRKITVVYAAIVFLLLSIIPLAWRYWPLTGLPILGTLLLWRNIFKHYRVTGQFINSLKDRGCAAGVLTAIHLGQILGFRAGVRNRPAVNRRRFAGIKRNILLLAGIPLNDTGGGQRSTQLALGFLAQDCRVTYVNRFPSYETRPAIVHYRHPQLDNIALKQFGLTRYLWEHEAILEKSVVIIEFPVPEYLALAKRLSAQGVTLIYDQMDKWDSALGGKWYSREVEDELIALSEILVATSRELKSELELRAPGKKVHLIPNAVNHHLFDPTKSYERPADLPKRTPIIGYAGSMYGEWFREDLVVKVAARNPRAAVVLIGDPRGRFSWRPPNLYTLGLKPHSELPAYLAHFDVCIIPFDTTHLIQATSPLKVFEYLAMGKPVVSTAMREVEGLPGVFFSRNDEEFLANILRARDCRLRPEETAAFTRRENWTSRVEMLLRLLENDGRR